MTNERFALLMHDHPEPFGLLEHLLKGLSVDVCRINSGGNAQELITRHKPGLIFVDSPVWNRSTARIINLAWGVDPAPNVIVVGSKPDIEEYVAAIERGAYSFVAPPFSHDGLKFIVNAALADVRARKEALSRGPFGHPESPQLLPHPARRGRDVEYRPWEPVVADGGAKVHP